MTHLISPQTGTAFILKTGQRLKVIDPEGRQVADFFCVSKADPRESLSSGRSMDYADTIYLTEGNLLYSNRSQPMLKIIKDSCRRHDFLMPPCSLKMFQIVSGTDAYHPSCDENLAVNLAKFDIPPDRISTTFNIFMNVAVREGGGLAIKPPISRVGDYVVFEALMDLVVGLTACSHPETNAGRCKPIHYEIN